MNENDLRLYIILLVIVIIILIWLIWLLLRKKIVVASMTVSTDKDKYSREETVKISGDVELEGEAEEGQTVNIEIIPPEGEAIKLEATTDAEGGYSADWLIPPDAVGGTYTLTATCLGAKATRTFTLNNSQIR